MCSPTGRCCHGWGRREGAGETGVVSFEYLLSELGFEVCYAAGHCVRTQRGVVDAEAYVRTYWGVNGTEPGAGGTTAAATFRCLKSQPYLVE